MRHTLSSALAELDLSGFTVKELDQGDLEMPTEDQAAQTIASCWSDLFAMFNGSALEREGEDVAWGLVNIFHRAAEKRAAALDRATDEIRVLVSEQDGSEVATSELEKAIDTAQTAEAAMYALETMREIAASCYARETGRSWKPISGTRSAPGKTNAVISGNAFLAARSAARRDRNLPKGTPVVFSGGRLDFPTEADAKAFVANLLGTLDKVHDRVGDMVLVHGGDSKGIDRHAASWAERKNVPQMVFGLDRKLGQRAGFDRNRKMLSTNPRYVVAFPGNGVLERLVIDAKAAKITVVDRRGPNGTRPAAAGHSTPEARAA